MLTTLRKLQKYPTLGLSAMKMDIKSDRRHDAASTAESVVAWLNAKPNAGTERVAGLIELCHRISKLVDEIKTSGGPAAWQNPEVQKAALDLNIRLGGDQYKWHPCVDPSMGSGSHFKLAFAIVGVEFDHARSLEHYAVQWIVQHIDAVQKVRRCQVPTCRQWYYAKTDHQKYCGDACRQKDAAQGDDFKEKRRVYMKKYRSAEAERDAQAKRVANRLARGKGK